MTSNNLISETSSQGSADWYATEVAAYEDDSARWGLTSTASQWAGHESHFACRSKVDEYRFLLRTVKNFVRLAEAPSDTEVRFSSHFDHGVAVAGYKYDADTGKVTSHILIDASKLMSLSSPQWRLEVAIGLALHEAAHLKWSGPLYSSPTAPESFKGMMENLIEDYRIEHLMIAEAPGWSGYLYATRRILLRDDMLRETCDRWDSLSDSEKLQAIIFMFVRAPHLLAKRPHLRSWKDTLGRTVLDELRRLMPTAPRTTDDVLAYAEALDQFVRRQGEPTMNLMSDLGKAYGDDCTVTGGLSQLMISQIALHPGTVELTDQRNLTALAPLKLPHYLGDVAKIPVCYRKLTGRDGAEVFFSHLNELRAEISRLQAVFAAPNQRCRRKPGATQGKLDSQRFWRATFDDQIFTRAVPTDGKLKARIILLLDASCSMRTDNRWINALRAGIVVSEALREHPLIQTDVFSHTTTRGDTTCQLTHHASRESIGLYAPSDSNFDGAAILAAVSIAEQTQPSERKILFVVSDGLPCGPYGTGGDDILDAALVRGRSQGWIVISIDTGEGYSAVFYGEPWSIIVQDTRELPAKLTRLLTSLLQ